MAMFAGAVRECARVGRLSVSRERCGLARVANVRVIGTPPFGLGCSASTRAELQCLRRVGERRLVSVGGHSWAQSAHCAHSRTARAPPSPWAAVTATSNRVHLHSAVPTFAPPNGGAGGGPRFQGSPFGRARAGVRELASSASRSAYEVLDVTQSCTDKEIKFAYLKVSQVKPPSRNPPHQPPTLCVRAGCGHVPLSRAAQRPLGPRY